MKKFIGIGLITFLVLTGCNENLPGIFNPIVGTWTNTVMGVPTNLVFDAGHTCTETTTLNGVGVTQNGTWTSDATRIFRTWSDDSVDAKYYSFSDDNTKLTLSNSAGGISVTYTKS